MPSLSRSHNIATGHLCVHSSTTMIRHVTIGTDTSTLCYHLSDQADLSTLPHRWSCLLFSSTSVTLVE